MNALLAVAARVAVRLAVVLPIMLLGASGHPAGTETGWDSGDGYPRDGLTLPTGEGVHIDYAWPKGQIPPSFDSQNGYYTVTYWPTGFGGTMRILAQSAFRFLDNDYVVRGVKFANGGAGWNLRDGSTVCGGFWVAPDLRWLWPGGGHGACWKVHA